MCGLQEYEDFLISFFDKSGPVHKFSVYICNPNASMLIYATTESNCC